MNIDKHHARKRFGQHFLHDQFVIQQIINVINPKQHDCLIEIGPGKGSLTVQLLEKVKHLDVIEIDRDLATSLEEQMAEHQSNLIIHRQDVLKTDFSRFNRAHLRIVGNLPYNISTALFFHLLQYLDLINDMIFMLQKEVAERICANRSQKKYGRLSIMLQYYCDIKYLFTVKPNCFIPAPKVDSAIVRLVPRKQPQSQLANHRTFSLLVKEAFSQRRKTIRNALKNYLSNDDFFRLNIPAEIRPEQLAVRDFVKLSNYYDSLKIKSS